jgi:hypothetical protein
MAYLSFWTPFYASMSLCEKSGPRAQCREEEDGAALTMPTTPFGFESQIVNEPCMFGFRLKYRFGS